MTKVNQNNEHERKSDIFSWDIFKSDVKTSNNCHESSESKQWKGNKIRHFFMGYINPNLGGLFRRLL